MDNIKIELDRTELSLIRHGVARHAGAAHLDRLLVEVGDGHAHWVATNRIRAGRFSSAGGGAGAFCIPTALVAGALQAIRELDNRRVILRVDGATGELCAGPLTLKFDPVIGAFPRQGLLRQFNRTPEPTWINVTRSDLFDLCEVHLASPRIDGGNCVMDVFVDSERGCMVSEPTEHWAGAVTISCDSPASVSGSVSPFQLREVLSVDGGEDLKLFVPANQWPWRIESPHGLTHVLQPIFRGVNREWRRIEDALEGGHFDHWRRMHANAGLAYEASIGARGPDRSPGRGSERAAARRVGCRGALRSTE